MSIYTHLDGEIQGRVALVHRLITTFHLSGQVTILQVGFGACLLAVEKLNNGQKGNT